MIMARPIQCLFFALTLLPTAPAFASDPGFDCAKAMRQIDKAICAWNTVGSLDGRMADAFKAAITAQTSNTAIAAVRDGQKAWLAERDRRCRLTNVTPKAGSEDGLSPREFGQLLCLQAIYPPRIAQLKDTAAPPLVPLDIKTVPIEPLQAAYPDDWRQAGYQAQFSPDKTLMALGVEDDAGYIKQVWLYQPASGRLTVASPRTHKGKTERPEDIAALNPWIWGSDGRFYVRANRPLGTSSVFVADMDGYAQADNLPFDVAEKFTAFDTTRKAPPATGDASGTWKPPGFDDDSHNEQDGGAFIAWAQNKGHGSFELMAARKDDDKPRAITSGGWELADFQLDPNGARLFYNGEDGIIVTDPDSQMTRRLKGTHGTSSETRPINTSADGEILVYSANGSCTRDAADEIGADADDDGKRVCLAYLAPAGSAPTAKLAPVTLSAKTSVDPADSWIGKWEGSDHGSLSATIRRGTVKPSYLVIDLVTGQSGCSGAVTLYGEPKDKTVLGESYDPVAPATPVCRVQLSIDNKSVLTTNVVGPCAFFHGGACGFNGSMTRHK
ncbi:MAG: lysozyme inhibitor LprI family protein [Xanthobacteraceae bacterium]